LRRLRQQTATSEEEIEATLALIVHTTQLERAEVAGASYLECFKGTNLRRTEINMATWAIQILSGNAILGFAVTLWVTPKEKMLIVACDKLDSVKKMRSMSISLYHAVISSEVLLVGSSCPDSAELRSIWAV
jgi:hypothetical protein